MIDNDQFGNDGIELHKAARSTVFALLMTGFGLGANYAFNVALAHWFGPSDFGLFAAGYALLNALAAVVILGLDAIVLREAAAAYARGDLDGAWAISRRAATMVLVAALLAAAFLAATADLVAGRFFASTPTIAPVLRGFALALPAIAVGTVLLAGLQGMHDVRVRMLLRYGLDPLLRFGLGAAAFAFGASILGAVFAVGAASAVMATTAWAMLRRMIARRRVGAVRSGGGIGWLALIGASWPLTLASVFNLAAARSDTLLILSLTGARAAGLYSAAMMTGAMITVLLMVIETILSPLFADRIARADVGEVAPLYRLGLRWVTLLAIPPFLLFAIAATDIMGLFGPDFRPAAGCFVLLSIGYLINCLTGSANYILILSGKVKLVLANSAVYAVLLIVGNYVAIRGWGILGAAVAMLVATLTLNVARLIEVQLLFRINPFSRASAWPAGIGLLVWGAAAALSRHFPDGTLWLLAAAAILIYAAVVLLAALDPEDRRLLARAVAAVRR